MNLTGVQTGNAWARVEFRKAAGAGMAAATGSVRRQIHNHALIR